MEHMEKFREEMLKDYKDKLDRITKENEDFSHQRGRSVRNITSYRKKIEAEAVCIRAYDAKVQANMDEYYRIAAEIRKLEVVKKK